MCSGAPWAVEVQTVPPLPQSASPPGLGSESSRCGSSLLGTWQSQGCMGVPRVGAEQTGACHLGPSGQTPGAVGAPSVGRPSGPAVLGTGGRSDSRGRSRGVAAHDRRELAPSHRDMAGLGQGLAGEGSMQRGGAFCLKACLWAGGRAHRSSSCTCWARTRCSSRARSQLLCSWLFSFLSLSFSSINSWSIP